MEIELGNYIINFDITLLGIILIVIIILILNFWIYFVLLSNETKTKIKNWIGQGFWNGVGLTLYSIVCFLIVSLVLYIIYLFFK